ncbi:MAG: amidohydrolase family protein [Bacteriovoracia bacterium]
MKFWRHMLKWCLLILTLFPQLAYAQLLLVRAGHVLDIENGIWKKNQTLLVREGRIVEVNPKSVPSKILELDLSQNYLIPGLIDAHTHLLLEDPTYGKDFAKGLLDFYKNNTIEERHMLANRRSHSLMKSGFTSVRDLGNSGSAYIAKLKKSDLRFYSSGAGHSPQMGQFPIGTEEKIVFDEYARLDDVSLSALKKSARSTLKLYADEDPNGTKTDQLILKKWVSRGKELGMKVAAHAIYSSAIQASIEAGVDSIEHGTYASIEQFKLMATKKIYWVPSTGTQMLNDKKFASMRSDHIPKELNLLCQKIPEAYKMGVRIVFGSDNYFSLEKWGISFGEATLAALLFLHKCGLPAIEVIRAATAYPSKLIGTSEIGRLEKGSWADFVVLKDDPLNDMASLARPVGVYLGGVKTH